ncbi:iron complex transport system permease protein [Mycetocola sp. BIGb0189]|uniref:iron chelate uptake ABC transporter family permease subunit n=1 Tax=Mycetocola sp. BIGb0189 TaxID=2940604 RepID=UPI002168DAFC|nr:iron chelate uptake ABC transporter family permease subunit [Mycetocola sp. BIGb0189]MCS4276300.1 iron complex transport system permease protein [Mycetocola sp. BIGb0189]
MAEREAADRIAPGAVGSSYPPAPREASRRATARVPRIWPRFVILGAVAILAAVGVLCWGIAPAPGSRGFWLVVERRGITVATMIVVAAAQSVATVLFHTATSNRILTPSIMGFEALYVVMQTALVFFWGAQSLAATDGLLKVAIQSVLMVALATLLYRWLFSGRLGNLHTMLLVGVILGMGFASVSTFMQRMLTPSEFDVLSARLFGNMSNSNPEYIPWATLVIGAVIVCVWTRRHRLDVLALGRETATNLGLNFRREVTGLLVITAILISISTTMVGPLTFFGFIVATLAYQLTGSSRHALVLPFAFLLGLVTLLGGYFILRHIFSAAGVLSVIIEFVGGLFFLIYLLRKGRL